MYINSQTSSAWGRMLNLFLTTAECCLWSWLIKGSIQHINLAKWNSDYVAIRALISSWIIFENMNQECPQNILSNYVLSNLYKYYILHEEWQKSFFQRPSLETALKVATKWTANLSSHCSNNKFSTMPRSVTSINKQFILLTANHRHGTPLDLQQTWT